MTLPGIDRVNNWRLKKKEEKELDEVVKNGAVNLHLPRPDRSLMISFGYGIVPIGILELVYHFARLPENFAGNANAYHTAVGLFFLTTGSFVTSITHGSYFEDTTILPPKKKKWFSNLKEYFAKPVLVSEK